MNGRNVRRHPPRPPTLRPGRRSYSFTALVERDEDGYYVATVPELKGCHTQAKTLAELEKRLKEVVALCWEVQKREVHQNKFVGVHQVELTA